MKKKLAMRIASLALCVVFVGMLFGAPKAEAVAVETAAVAIGVAVLGSYVAATQLRFTGDVADTISIGISSLVSDWVEASAVAASADDWLANLGNATQMTSPGILQMQGAFARGCAQFVEWLTETFGLDEDGDEVSNVAGTQGVYLYNGVALPRIWPDSTRPNQVAFCSASGVYYLLCANGPISYNSESQSLFASKGTDAAKCRVWGISTSYDWSVTIWTNSAYGSTTVQAPKGSYGPFVPVWSNFDLVDNVTSEVYLSASDPVVLGSLDITREEDFANPAVDAADDDSITISTGLTSSTLSDFALDVPAQIAAGEFAPTVELTQEGEGTGEEVETPDDSTVVPGVTPWLESIFNAIKGIADKIVNGIKGLFVPDQEAVDSFSDEVDAKLPFIGTLQGFGGDLAYKLEHPEECANGLGLTTVVDLEKGRGSYLGTAKHDLLDLSWYLEYKPMVDDIIVGFCWLCFLWNCYGALPRIIHGEGSIAGVISILRKEDGNP